MTEQPQAQLTGRIGLIPALAANLLNMVGVGPFLTVPLVIGAMGGPQAMLGWAAGALIALCDGLVWAELGAAMPGSGGSYHYLREAYGPERWGRLMSFLFLAQTVIAGPLTAASGAVGFAEYAHFLVPSLSFWAAKALAVFICLVATFLLYRNIRDVGKLSIAMSAVLIATMAWIIFAGATHFDAHRAFDFPAGAFQFSREFFLGLGAATLIAMYDYSGYWNVCLIGDEVKEPARTIPRCILISILFLGCCYAAMSTSIIGVLPWREAMQSKAIVSDFMLRISGAASARMVTIMILIAAFGSVYSVLLGYTRVPFAAARQGEFFAVFARVHRTGGFPSFSVLTMGLASAAACFLSLDELIKALLVIQILTQFIAQCIAVVLIRKYRTDIRRPFSMALYPLPAAIALVGWVLILASSGSAYILAGLGTVIAGIVGFLIHVRRRGAWA